MKIIYSTLIRKSFISCFYFIIFFFFSFFMCWEKQERYSRVFHSPSFFPPNNHFLCKFLFNIFRRHNKVKSKSLTRKGFPLDNRYSGSIIEKIFGWKKKVHTSLFTRNLNFVSWSWLFLSPCIIFVLSSVLDSRKNKKSSQSIPNKKRKTKTNKKDNK